ncbi:heat shock protein HspQ [Parasphingorhabdus flavimaris]|jgi:heat shock protein HspQ|uniref:Heat shock protein HspQ n=1 Tax=Parasphingorhabdus flavimaris TaxID=266812 RepID=A0ABX2N186_9SPHN|nr:heat shock protein HspQ [Parasphingorhabdus flavimaris]NVD27466.1 heat shock protein HspQ [Parasphingorhabdus flavimaris]|tara:strand:+ start:5679 stop:6059 length:381 start_codon:yes stop_codon:yes gene_type:complete
MHPLDPFKSGNPLPANTPDILDARFAIGDVVRHRIFDFRGVIYDIDPVFANSDEWYDAIPQDLQPPKDQPFYHLFAENTDSSYVAYVSQQNLLPDDSGEPISHPDVARLFQATESGQYLLHGIHRH